MVTSTASGMDDDSDGCRGCKGLRLSISSQTAGKNTGFSGFRRARDHKSGFQCGFDFDSERIFVAGGDMLAGQCLERVPAGARASGRDGAP